LDVSTFFADTTALSDSLITRRGQTGKEHGGVANTEDFSSFSIALGGTDFYSLDNNIVEGLSYQIGYAEQGAGVNNDADETRASISLEYRHQFSQDVKGRLVTEHVDIQHFGGEAAHDRAYSMVAWALDYRRWNFSVSYLHVDNRVGELSFVHHEDEHEDHHDEEEDDHGEHDEEEGHEDEEHDHAHEAGAEGLDGHVFQVSVGYRFDSGFGIDGGYQYMDEEGETTERVGLMLSYEYEF